MEDGVLANVGVDVFEEVFKLIFTKLYDKYLSQMDKGIQNYFLRQVTKTSVLFIQKWDDELCPKVDDYPIFFAVSEKGDKDTSGDYIYVKNGNGQYKLDRNGHLVVDHNLHNHDGELPDGIEEAFIEWRKAKNYHFLNKHG